MDPLHGMSLVWLRLWGDVVALVAQIPTRYPFGFPSHFLGHRNSSTYDAR